MKRAVTILSFLIPALFLVLSHQGALFGSGGVPIVEDPAKAQTKSSGGGVRLMVEPVVEAPVGQLQETVLLNEGIDDMARSLMNGIATRYFHLKNKPITKVAVFDFTDPKGNITVGSRYIADRIRLAFGGASQFSLANVQKIREEGVVMTPEKFEEIQKLRGRIVDELGADVYILGRIESIDVSDMVCRVSLWGTLPPHYDKWDLSAFTLSGEGEEMDAPAQWKLNLTESGLSFFTRVVTPGKSEIMVVDQVQELVDVIFLTQPLCDDLNLSWQIRADGLVYDSRKDEDVGTLSNRGQVMESRVKSLDALKERSYVIREFSLVVEDSAGEATQLEPYVLPKGSEYFFIPFEEGNSGLRFLYLWNKRGKSKRISSMDTGMGWKLFEAEQNWPTKLEPGPHIATATLKPLVESDYGTKISKSEFVSRFKFFVKPGMTNIYVINYAYRIDRPEIFVRRLDIEGFKDYREKESIKKITKVYKIYGL